MKNIYTLFRKIKFHIWLKSEKIGLKIKWVKDYAKIVFIVYGGFLAIDFFTLGDEYFTIKEKIFPIIMVFIFIWQFNAYEEMKLAFGLR